MQRRSGGRSVFQPQYIFAPFALTALGVAAALIRIRNAFGCTRARTLLTPGVPQMFHVSTRSVCAILRAGLSRGIHRSNGASGLPNGTYLRRHWEHLLEYPV